MSQQFRTIKISKEELGMTAIGGRELTLGHVSQRPGTQIDTAFETVVQQRANSLLVDKAITWCTSSWRESGAYDWLLNDRQVDDCREHPEQNREPPNDIIRPGALEDLPHTPRKPPTLKNARPNKVASQRVPNITTMKSDVGGTVDSQNKPSTAPKTRVTTVLGGSIMYRRMAMER